jgi:hypothetical protein
MDTQPSVNLTNPLAKYPKPSFPNSNSRGPVNEHDAIRVPHGERSYVGSGRLKAPRRAYHTVGDSGMHTNRSDRD